MVFNLEKFLKAPDARVIETLKKDKLFEFVTKFHLNIERSARKVEMRNAVVQHVVEQEVLVHCPWLLKMSKLNMS